MISKVQGLTIPKGTTHLDLSVESADYLFNGDFASDRVQLESCLASARQEAYKMHRAAYSGERVNEETTYEDLSRKNMEEALKQAREVNVEIRKRFPFYNAEADIRRIEKELRGEKE